ncbi:MAG: glycosyltransferase family 39 protein [Chloroflexota bacterium]|nr:glycosyltransferase family 39 protein [Chloroflexota bacterium]
MVRTRPILWGAARARRVDRGLLVLLLTFVLLLPLLTPRLYATDSVQYYVYLRSLAFDRDLDFTNEYARFHELNPDSGIAGALLPRQDPTTGELFNIDPHTHKPINVAPVGSAILWAPAFALAHGVVLLANVGGAAIPADGFSTPYIAAICLASALYGLGGLLLCYRIARRYSGVWAATAATIVCWLASPLLFYMYISPPWSHTGGLFMVALFVWYWLRTRPQRSLGQWLWLGLIGGLMVMSREQLGLFLLLPALEALTNYWRLLRTRQWTAISRLFAVHAAFLVVFVVALAPQLLAYITLNGHIGPSEVVLAKLRKVPPDPYAHGFLGSGHFWDTLVDPRPSPATGRWFAHGAFLWTPVWALALAGLPLLWRRDRLLLALLGVALFAQVWVNGRFGTTWHLSGAFGFRRLIEASPVFVLGLALLIERLRLPRGAWTLLGALLIAWNIGLIFQWTVLGTADKELRRGLVWETMLRHQLSLPIKASQKLPQLLFDRDTFYENKPAQ